MPQVATQGSSGLATIGLIVLAGLLAVRLFGLLGGTVRSAEITKQLRSLPVVMFFFGPPEDEEAQEEEQNTTQAQDAPTPEEEDDFDYEAIFGTPNVDSSTDP